MLGELSAHLKRARARAEASPVTPPRLAALIALVGDGTLVVGRCEAGVRGARGAARARRPRDASSQERGLAQIGDHDALGAVVDEVVGAHPAEVDAYRGGKQQLIGFFTGQVMRASGGRADPKRVQELLRDRLGAPTR